MPYYTSTQDLTKTQGSEMDTEVREEGGELAYVICEQQHTEGNKKQAAGQHDKSHVFADLAGVAEE